MVAKAALDMAGKLHSLDLDPDYKLLKTRYFGGDGQGPSTLSWKPSAKFKESAPKQKASDALKPASKDTAAQRASGGCFANKGASAAVSAPAEQAKKLPAATAPWPATGTAKAATRPTHTILYRAVGALGPTGGLSGAWNDTRLHGASTPLELVVKIELPNTASAASVALDITEERVALTDDEAKYELNLELPCKVDSEKGSAKFDKAKRTLTLTLPVLAKHREPAVWEPPSKGQTDAELEAEAEAARKAEEAERTWVEAEAAARRQQEREARQQEAKAEEEAAKLRREQAIARAKAEELRRQSAAARAPSAKQPDAAAPVAPQAPVKPFSDAPVKPASDAPVKPASDGARLMSPSSTDKSSDSEWEMVGREDAAASPAAALPDPTATSPAVQPEPAKTSPAVPPEPTKAAETVVKVLPVAPPPQSAVTLAKVPSAAASQVTSSHGQGERPKAEPTGNATAALAARQSFSNNLLFELD